MSTSTSTSRTTSSKAAQTEHFRTLVEELDHNARQDLIIFLTKENKKNVTKTGRAKRAPKLDEDGNVIKKPRSPGLIAWDEYVNHIKAELTEMYPGTKILRKACLRLGKLLKAKGEAADEGENSFYPAENLSTESLQEEWEAWSALPAEEQYPKKEEKGAASDAEEEEEPKPKAKKASKAAASDSEAEAKPKARGRPKKASPLDEEEEEEAAQSSTESKASKKSKSKSKAAEEEEEPKPKKAKEAEPEKKKEVKKAKAKVEESEDEAEVKPKKGKGKKKEE